jgi:solute carrier family 25 phosphate transporter 3
LKGFTIGWHATLLGYSAQGFGKFGFYEMFKDVYKWLLGPKAAQYQTVGFLASSACAEVIADTFLAPFEAVSISRRQLFLSQSKIFIITMRVD